MTLIEYMSRADNESLYYIGAKSSFLFIGKRARFMQDIEELEDHNVKRWNRIYKAAQDNLRICNDKGVPSDPKEQEEYCKKMDELGARVLALARYLKNYKPLIEREVIELYEKEVGAGQVIIIDGLETGHYWFEKEYDTKKVEKDTE